MAYKLTAAVPKAFAKGSFGKRVDFYSDTEFTLVSDTPFPEEDKEYRLRWGLGYLYCDGKDISVKRIVDIDNPTSYEDVGKIVVFNEAPIEEYDEKNGIANRADIIWKVKYDSGYKDVRKFYEHYGIVVDLNIESGIYTIRTEEGKIVWAERKWFTFTDKKCAESLLSLTGKNVLILNGLETCDGEYDDAVMGMIGTIVGIEYLSYAFCKSAMFFVRVGEKVYRALIAHISFERPIVLAKEGCKEGDGVSMPCASCENNENGNCKKHQGYSFMTECEKYKRFREWYMKAGAGEVVF